METDNKYDSLLVCNIMFMGSQQILLIFCAVGVKENAPRPILFLTEYQAGSNNQKLMKNKYINIQLPFLLFCVVLHQLLHG